MTIGAEAAALHQRRPRADDAGGKRIRQLRRRRGVPAPSGGGAAGPGHPVRGAVHLRRRLRRGPGLLGPGSRKGYFQETLTNPLKTRLNPSTF